MSFRQKLHTVIFEADTPAGKAFDVLLILSVLGSVAAVLLESVSAIERSWGPVLRTAEWVFTVLFTIEYLLRLYAVRKPLKYAGSFFGIIDLLAILPTYIAVIVPHSRFLLTIRILRVLRVFRVFKLATYIRETRQMASALKASSRKIIIFLLAVLTLVVFLGALMYTIEGGQPGTSFTSIPRSIYWAIVTLTTVGYGDISPVTPLGQACAALIMILGYSIIVVPTGFVSVEMTKTNKQLTTQACPACSKEGHDGDAIYCKYCGETLN